MPCRFWTTASVQAYAQDAQEALDLALMAYAVAEDPTVRTPFMVNLDGFTITHTYEPVDVPSQEAADAFLPPYDAAGNRFDFEHPVNMGYSAGPAFERVLQSTASTRPWPRRCRWRCRLRRTASPSCSDAATRGS